MGQGRGQSSQAGTSGTQGRVYAITRHAELTDQSVIQSIFYSLVYRQRVLFDYGASRSFVAASCVKDLGLEVKTLEEPLHMSSPLGVRVSDDKIYRSVSSSQGFYSP